MRREFQQFVDKWHAAGFSGGRFQLPVRSAITITDFQEFLPRMMIASWDMVDQTSKVLYAGTKIDQAFRRDIRHSPMRAMFASEEHIAAHVAIAMTVIREKVAAEVHADLLIDGGAKVTISQIRLPLAPEGDVPLVVSLFMVPDTGDLEQVAELPVVQNFRHHFIEVMPREERIA